MDRLTPERAGRILEGIRSARVLVVGDLMLDRYIVGAVDRISPEAPVPVVLVEEESAAVGGAANVAANVAALGASCRVVGCVGRDAAGELLQAELAALGIATDGLVLTDERPTTVKTRILARRQQVVRVDRETEADASPGLCEALSDAVAASASESDILVAEDYNKGVLVPRVIRAVLEAAMGRGIPAVVDPKRRNFFAYPGATVFKPNAKELADAVGDQIHPDDPAWMEATRIRLACRNLLLTLGDRGMALQSAAEGHIRIPTVARSVYDVSGAGDIVTAVMALGIAAGASVVEAALLASHAAAVGVGKAGVAAVTPDEILCHVQVHQELHPIRPSPFDTNPQHATRRAREGQEEP
jgi:D-beta-D-heptose 7-phosphate kinase/D-beta-D-heptose 1-phosphate adenosyltransferase